MRARERIAGADHPWASENATSTGQMAPTTARQRGPAGPSVVATAAPARGLGSDPALLAPSAPPRAPWPLIQEEYVRWELRASVGAELEAAADQSRLGAVALGGADAGARHALTRVMGLAGAAIARRGGRAAARLLPVAGLLLGTYNLAAKVTAGEGAERRLFHPDCELLEVGGFFRSEAGESPLDRRIRLVGAGKAAASVADAVLGLLAAALGTAALLTLIVPGGGLSLGALAVIAGALSLAASAAEAALGLWLASLHRQRALGPGVDVDEALVQLQVYGSCLRDAVAGAGEKTVAARAATAQLRSLPTVQIRPLPARPMPRPTDGPRAPPAGGQAAPVRHLVVVGGPEVGAVRAAIGNAQPSHLPSGFLASPHVSTDLSHEGRPGASAELLGDLPDAERAAWAMWVGDGLSSTAGGDASTGATEVSAARRSDGPTAGPVIPYPGAPPVSLLEIGDRWRAIESRAEAEATLLSMLQEPGDAAVLAEWRGARSRWHGEHQRITEDLQHQREALAAWTADAFVRVGVEAEAQDLAERARATSAALGSAPATVEQLSAALGAVGIDAPQGLDALGVITTAHDGGVDPELGAEDLQSLGQCEDLLRWSELQRQELQRAIDARRVVEEEWEAEAIARREADRRAIAESAKERGRDEQRLAVLVAALAAWATAHRRHRLGDTGERNADPSGGTLEGGAMSARSPEPQTAPEVARPSHTTIREADDDPAP